MDAERLLGYLMKSGLRGSQGINLGSKAMLGMGALGVAMAAYEHFTDQSNASASATSRPTPPPPPPSVPPSNADSKSNEQARRSTPTPPVPPPPPTSPTTASPAPSPPSTESAQLSSEESLLLIRAMIAAANADNFIDQEEEKRIIESARASGFGADDLEFLESEINRPWSVFEIATGATTPELGKQVYVASLLAIDVDSNDETDYLRRLASSLHLSDEVTDGIHAEMGIRVNNE